LSWLVWPSPAAGAGVLFALHVLVGAFTSGHILLHKESERSATGWLALVWLSPLVGSGLYVLLGINRVRRKAARLRVGAPALLGVGAGPRPDPRLLGHLAPIRRAVDALTPVPLVAGNAITPLRNGEEAYPAMLAAIAAAERTVALQTFLFDDDAWGRRFVHELAEAQRRGVEVRVLIDGVGVWFSWPPVLPVLRRAGVPFRRFLWSLDPRRMTLLNLRNHRKTLVVDGRVGFTGGMNVRGTFVQEDDGPRTAEQDLHFRVEGPLVRQLLDLFATDWAFDTGHALDGERWATSPGAAGPVSARVVAGGPDDEHDRLSLVLLEGIGCARHSVRVQSPYFIPEEPLELALIAAARRGVEVDVVVPERSNHPLVDATMRAQLPRLLAHGVRVWAQPPPFDHGKLVVVDELWSCFGSANWDPRSLRLNFEMLVEAYDGALARELTAIFEAKRARCLSVRRELLVGRPMLGRLFDGAARLLKPYL
jgi:cardiolipin synthase